MLINKISKNEIEMMNIWREYYAYSSNAEPIEGQFVSSEIILEEWEKQKNLYLSKLLNNNLILCKDIEYKISHYELAGDMYELTKIPVVSDFIRKYKECLRILCAEGKISKLIEGELSALVLPSLLAKNIYNEETFIFHINGKKYKVQKGCKIIKFLGKLVKEFGLDYEIYKRFAILHSQVLNQKYLKGKLTLSIHPLDYMTMSDNRCNWDTCMSWSLFEAHRQGTVEMMNSPCVIVAYLSAEKGMRIGREYEWSNKKWRQLFVVDKNIIAGIKGYPYENNFLAEEVINWIKELAKENLGWTYGDNLSWDCGDEDIVEIDYFPEEMRKTHLIFETEHMYNDFGCAESHLICLGDNITKDDLILFYRANKPCLKIRYSGKSQCMICGVLNPWIKDASYLACEYCQEVKICERCDELVSQLYTVDGRDLCSDCYESIVQRCEICEEEHLIENMVKFYVLPRFSEEKKQDLLKTILNNGLYCPNKSAYSDCNYFLEQDTIWVCDKPKEIERFINDYLKPGETFYWAKRPWHSDDRVIYIDQLNELGKSTFLLKGTDYALKTKNFNDDKDFESKMDKIDEILNYSKWDLHFTKIYKNI